jgi:hypothetical protein
MRCLGDDVLYLCDETYDELLTRVRNYIQVLEEFRKAPVENAADEKVP